MIPESTIQASKGQRQPTIPPSHGAYGHEESPHFQRKLSFKNLPFKVYVIYSLTMYMFMKVLS